MNEFLQGWNQINAAAASLDAFGWHRHVQPEKCWDLAHVVPLLRGGPVLDMGCYCSFVLHNVVRRGLGPGYGVDLNPLDEGFKQKGCTYFLGDLCDVPLPTASIKFITCLSVIEHGVDFRKFVDEASRLLEPGGMLWVTFDYWPDPYPLQVPGWNLLSRREVERLIYLCESSGLFLTMPVDWTTREGVLQASNWFPICAGHNMPYTFGILEFQKLYVH